MTDEGEGAADRAEVKEVLAQAEAADAAEVNSTGLQRGVI